MTKTITCSPPSRSIIHVCIRSNHGNIVSLYYSKGTALACPVYSETSDSGPSEIGTQYNKPLNKGRFSRSQVIGFPIVLIHFEPPRRGQPLYKGQNTWIHIVPKVTFIRRFDCIHKRNISTLYICINYTLNQTIQACVKMYNTKYHELLPEQTSLYNSCSSYTVVSRKRAHGPRQGGGRIFVTSLH